MYYLLVRNEKDEVVRIEVTEAVWEMATTDMEWPFPTRKDDDISKILNYLKK